MKASKKLVLTRLFLNQSEEEWPTICDKLFEEAYKGNYKVLLFIAEYSMIKLSHLVITEPTVEKIESLEDVEKLSSVELKELAAKIINEYKDIDRANFCDA